MAISLSCLSFSMCDVSSRALSYDRAACPATAKSKSRSSLVNRDRTFCVSRLITPIGSPSSPNSGTHIIERIVRLEIEAAGLEPRVARRVGREDAGPLLEDLVQDRAAQLDRLVLVGAAMFLGHRHHLAGFQDPSTGCSPGRPAGKC